MSVVALPVARISVGQCWLRPPSPVVFMVGQAETRPDQNHLHHHKFMQKLKHKKQIKPEPASSNVAGAS
jgi:hypothetical protein